MVACVRKKSYELIELENESKGQNPFGFYFLPKEFSKSFFVKKQNQTGKLCLNGADNLNKINLINENF